MTRTFNDIGNKEELIGVLYSLRASAIYDIFAQICLHEFIKQAHKGVADLDSLATILPDGEITLKQFLDQLNSHGPRAAVETKRNANRFLTRNTLKESFRITVSYCHMTKQGEVLKNESWYQFARILVNTLSHSFRFDPRPYDLTILPVSYKDIEINESMSGKPIFIQLQTLVELMDEILEFADKRLS